MTPPAVLESVKAVYPADELGKHMEASVLLLATVEVDGSVSAASVLESGGDSFDRAAIAALKQWRFSPAKRQGVPFVSQVRVPFRFALAGHPPEPTAKPETPPSPPPPSATPPAPHIETDKPPLAEEPPPEAAQRYESTVRTRQPPPPRATSDFVIDRTVLTAAPHQSAGDLLSSAPGVYIARPEGDAVAHQVYLRGFDAEHGQDIEFTVGPVPINQPAHIHGQGYADLNFVIPEVVRSLRVTEGVYDPRQGDFAVAGSVDFDLGVAERGFQSHSAFGSFGTFRQLVLWAPRGQPEETFGAVSIRRSSGFGQNRGSLSGSAIGQFAFGSGDTRGVAHVAAYGGRAGLAGVLRVDDIEAGRVDFYGTYRDPTATAQSALSTRAQAAVNVEHRAQNGARTTFAVWFLFTTFRLRENFTGYTQRSRQRPDFIGRGDLIEQEHRDIALGARFAQRTRRLEPTSWLSGTFETGLSFRTDFIDQAQSLLQAPQNEIWDRRVDASIRGADIGLYVDGDFRFTKYFRLRGGFRADVLYYDIDDRLGNFVPSSQQPNNIIGYRRTALGVAWGPRFTAEAEPIRSLTLTASYGEGYRSPQPRQLEEGENAPFSKVRSIEGGFRLRLYGDHLTLHGAVYATLLSRDLAFDPQEGRLEQIGPTRRVGGVAYLVARPLHWILASLSVTYVHATLTAPPPATVENPVPAFVPGQLLPYVPPVVIRADVGVNRRIAQLGKHELEGRAGLGFTFLSPRPLPFGQQAAPVSLLDLSAALRWWFVELGLQIFNLVNTRYAAVPYSFASDWGTRSVPSLLPVQHISAGPPRAVMGTVGFHF